MIAQWLFAGSIFTALAAVAAQCASIALHATRRPTRFAWLAALVLSVVWIAAAPLFLVTDRPTSARPGIDVVQPAWRAVNAGPVTNATTPRASPVALPDVDTTLLVVWGATSAAMLLQLAWMLRRLARIRRSGRPAMIDGVRVVVTDDVGPALVGAGNMEIVVPSWLQQLDPGLRALVFRHEEEHRIARDPYMIWIAVIATVLVPWNVAAWFIASRLRLAIEIDCDARTLAHGADRHRYAKLLLFIAQHRTSLPFASMLAGTESHLSRRINAMSESSPRFRRFRIAAAGGVALLAIAVACSTRLTEPVSTDVVSAARANQTASATSDPYFDFQVDKPAKVVTFEAAYPAQLRARGDSALLMLQFVVSADGRAEMGTFKVLRTQGTAISEFTDVARGAIEFARFTPAEVAGARVRQLVQLPLQFAASTTSIGTAAQKSALSSAPATPNPTASVARTQRPSNDSLPYFDFQVDVPAMTKSTGGLEYPAALRSAGIRGTALVQFVVNTDGTADPRTFKVLKADRAEFAEAVERALPKMTFSPATVGGRPVKQLLQLPFAFDIP